MNEIKKEKLISPKSGKRTIINLIGNKFGRLTVISFNGLKDNEAVWNCLCDCGNKTKVKSGNLKKKNTKSCGCLFKEWSKKAGKIIGGKNVNENSSFKWLFDSYKRKALKRKIKFLISIEEFKDLTKQKCHYCGEPPFSQYRSSHSHIPYIYNGIDRTDSSLDYCKENCVPCCKNCNWAKRTLSYNDFIELIKKIHKNLNL